jgi:hypothetical protein
MRSRSLTDAQAAELRHAYRLYLENRPPRLCARFGISRTTLRHYVAQDHSSNAYRRKLRDCGY